MRLLLFALLLPALPLLRGDAAEVRPLPQDPGVPDFEEEVFPFLDRYCLYCHEGSEAEGGIDLALHLSEEEARTDPELYWAAAWKVWDHAMPPPRREEQPSDEERARFLAWVDHPEGLGRPQRAPAPVLRRMNRAIYARSVEDLCGVSLPEGVLASLPEDESGDGFDNIGASLTLADDAVLRYLEAAEVAASRAVVPFEAVPERRRWVGNELDATNTRGTAAALWSQGSVGTMVTIEQAGRYRFRIGAYGDQAGDEPCLMELLVDGRDLHEAEVPTEQGEDTVVEVEVRLDAGGHLLKGRFTNDYWRPDLPEGEARDRNLYIAWIELEGPLDPPAPTAFQRGLFERHPLRGEFPGRAPAIAGMIDELATKAWRRPPTREERRRLARLVAEERSWEEVVRLCLTALMTSPHFLFESTWEPERLSAAGRRELEGHELATRLAFFLWGRLPDAALLAEAADPAWAGSEDALRRTVERMLDDPRSIALAEDFASQAFRIRGLLEHEVDAEVFPEVDAALLASMQRETEMLFLDVLARDLDLGLFLDADYSFVDRPLAAHYGLDFPPGEGDWRRVELGDTPRRGILGHASVLTMTSMATRTSPVRRGKWILDNLIGAPPPPPPADAGALDEDPEAAREATLRERLAMHRDQPQCISCHMVMDPLGFSLERFDAVGRWRDMVDGLPVDAGGRLPDGTALDGLAEVVDVLEERDGFARLMVARLTSFALGRGLVPADRALVQEVLDRMDPARPTLRGAIEGIVLSEAFRTRPQGRRAWQDGETREPSSDGRPR